MERAAETALRTDSSFFEVLHALEWQIQSDGNVKTVADQLAAEGFVVTHCFVPHIRVKVKTQDALAAPAFSPGSASPQMHDVTSTLTEQLKHAAYEVISASAHRHRLEQIINEAVFANRTFQILAYQLETAGYNLVISLDFSNYPQLREKPQASPSLNDTASQLTAADREFLKAMHIRFNGSCG